MKFKESVSIALKEHPVVTRVLLIIELLLILICLIKAILPLEPIRIAASDISLPIELPAGSYRICVNYEAEAGALAGYQIKATVPGGKLLADGVNLYEGQTVTDNTIWLTAKTTDLQVVFFCNGDGKLSVGDMTIVPTHGLWRTRLLELAFFFVILDAIYLLYMFQRYCGLSDEEKKFLLGFAGIVLFSSIPLFMDFIPEQDDILFHLCRIEGVARGLKAGIFPVRIQPGWLGGQGYASSIFYGDTLLYIPALLRLWGFSLQTSYQIFMVINNLLSAWIMYVCGKKMTGDPMIALIGAFIYNASEYHLVNLYARGAIGEAVAMTFLPLVIYGLYHILDGDTEQTDYKYAFIVPAIGYAGIIQSHTLSIEMVGILTILLCMVCIRRTLQKKRFFQLVKTAAVGLLLSVWFIIPFIDELGSDIYRITAITSRTIQEGGLYLLHLILPIMHTGRSADFVNNGLQDSMPLSIGLALVFILISYVTYVFFNNEKRWREKKAEKVLFLFALLSILLTLNIFPWNAIQSVALKHNEKSFVATLISSIQFPWRFLSIATPLIVMLGMLLLKHKKDADSSSSTFKQDILSYRFLTLCLTGSLILTSGIFFADLYENRGIIRVYDDDGMGDGVVMGGEYLPEGTEPALLTHGNCYAEGALVLDSFTQENLIVQAAVSGDEGTLTVPLLYYKGYEAVTTDGNQLDIYAGENNQLAVRFPQQVMQAGNGSQEVSITFQSPWYWRVAELISMLTVLGLIFYSWICVRPCKIRLHSENS